MCPIQRITLYHCLGLQGKRLSFQKNIEYINKAIIFIISLQKPLTHHAVGTIRWSIDVYSQWWYCTSELRQNLPIPSQPFRKTPSTASILLKWKYNICLIHYPYNLWAMTQSMMTKSASGILLATLRSHCITETNNCSYPPVNQIYTSCLPISKEQTTLW